MRKQDDWNGGQVRRLLKHFKEREQFFNHVGFTGSTFTLKLGCILYQALSFR